MLIQPKKNIRHLLTTFFAFHCLLSALGQTNISGIVNSYYAVSSIVDPACGTCEAICSPTFTLASTAGLAAGSRVMIMQMKSSSSGTILNGSTYRFDPTFGDITDYGGAGNWELATINNVAGADVDFTLPLVNDYDVTGAVQLISVVSDDAGLNTTGNITGAVWDGTTGGVIALETTGTLTLNHGINADFLGFSGGVYVDKSSACCSNPNMAIAVRYAYYLTEVDLGGGSGCSENKQNRAGSLRGNAIFDEPTGQLLGYGHYANGGGGGQGHNSGGGGGGNGTAGGRGGYEFGGCNFSAADNTGGRGGQALSNGTAVFLGGGGGSGHGNEGDGTGGGTGGGIIMISAGTVNTILASTSISALGSQPGASTTDGSGGGGSGGTILMDVGSYTGSALLIDASGANGGDNLSVSTCHAPGGGGGAGVIRSSATTLPIAGVTMTVNSGASGNNTVDPSCAEWGATGSANGSPTPDFSLNFSSCVLPVDLLYFKAKNEEDFISLKWATATEKDNSHFVIQKGSDGIHFSDVTEVVGHGNSFEEIYYHHNDYSGDDYYAEIIYYRLMQVDYDGKKTYHRIISVQNPKRIIDHAQISNFDTESSSIDIFGLDGVQLDEKDISVYSITGIPIRFTLIDSKENVQRIVLPKQEKGIYSLVIDYKIKQYFKFVIE